MRENILHLTRGQVFTIGGTTFFTMGGAVSHDIQDGILNPGAPDFERTRRTLQRRNNCFLVNGRTWWVEEMPSDEGVRRGPCQPRKNRPESKLHSDPLLSDQRGKKISARNKADRLTDFLEEILRRCIFDFWFFGHYHGNRMIDDLFMLQWEQISELSDWLKNKLKNT